VVVEPDGRLAETPSPVGQRVATLFDLARRAAWGLNAPASNATDLTERLRAQLRRVAQRGVPITCQELARSLGLEPPNTIHQLTSLLEALMEEDATAGCPFIAALVVSKARRGLPALGFFDCARRLGRYDSDDGDVEAWACHAQEFAAAVAYWRDAEPGMRDRPRDY
jgi:hypothetical protein